MSGAQADAAPPTPEAAPTPKLAWIETTVRVAAVAAALAVAWLVTTRWNTWIGAAAMQETNDAYLIGYLTPFSARVAGLVKSVPVTDYQKVRARDVLAEIEDKDYAAQVRQAEVALAGAEAALANLAE